MTDNEHAVSLLKVWLAWWDGVRSPDASPPARETRLLVGSGDERLDDMRHALEIDRQAALVLNHEIGEKLSKLADRLMSTTEFGKDAHTVLDAAILLMKALETIVDYEAKLDAVAEVLEHPKGAWKIAGCDVLAHYVKALQDNYIALRDAPQS